MILASLRVDRAAGVSIRRCNADHTIPIDEYTNDFVFSAEFNIQQAPLVIWHYTDDNGTRTTIAQCYLGNSTCVSEQSYSPILAVLNAHTGRSQIVIPDVVRGRFPDGVWTFQAGSAEANCTTDVIYPVKNADCEVTINLNMKEVGGMCNVSRLYSSRGKYACTWMEQIDAKSEALIPASQTTFSRQNLSASEVTDYSAVCSFNKSLPLASTFRYRAVISPGNASPPIAYRYVGTAGPQSEAISVTPTTAINLASTLSAINLTSTLSDLRSTPSDEGTTKETPKGVDESTARLEGIGIGVAIALAFVTFVIIIVVILWRCRGRKPHHEETERVDDGFNGPYVMNSQISEEALWPEPGTFSRRSQDSDYSSIADTEAAVSTITKSSGSTTCRKVPYSAGGFSQGQQGQGQQGTDTTPAQRNTGINLKPIFSPLNTGKTDAPEENPYKARISMDDPNPYPSNFHFSHDLFRGNKSTPSDCEYIGMTRQNQENEQTDIARWEEGGGLSKTEEHQENKGAEYMDMDHSQRIFMR